MVVMKLAHLGNRFVHWFMFHGDPVGSNHDSCTVSPTLAMNKNLGLRIRADQIEELNNFGAGWIVAPAPWNAYVLHTE